MAFGTVPRVDFEGLYGFDASIYIHTIDWRALEQANRFQFGFIECASASTASATFKQIWDDPARTLPCGPYQRICSSLSGQAQAAMFIKYFEAAASGLHENDLPPVLDVEADQNGHIATKDIYVAIMDEWIAVIEQHFKRRPIIYTGPSFWKQIGEPSQYASHPLWIANYCVPRPDVPQPWQGYHFWQYAQEVSFAEFNYKAVDLDFFGGNGAQLQELILSSKIV
jgi:lysozyme